MTRNRESITGQQPERSWRSRASAGGDYDERRGGYLTRMVRYWQSAWCAVRYAHGALRLGALISSTSPVEAPRPDKGPRKPGGFHRRGASPISTLPQTSPLPHPSPSLLFPLLFSKQAIKTGCAKSAERRACSEWNQERVPAAKRTKNELLQRKELRKSACSEMN